MQNWWNLKQLLLKPLTKLGGKVLKDFLNSTFWSKLNFVLFGLIHWWNLSLCTNITVTYYKMTNNWKINKTGISCIKNILPVKNRAYFINTFCGELLPLLVSLIDSLNFKYFCCLLTPLCQQWWRDSNPQPSDGKASVLPLCYCSWPVKHSFS